MLDLMPQVNSVGKPALMQVGSDAHQGPKRKLSERPLEQFLKDWHDHIRQEQELLRKLIEMSVTLHRRFRGLTLNDQVGRYGVRRNTDGKWLDYDPDLDGEIHPINIIQPAIRANTNACLQSMPQVEVASANANARHRQIAMRWQRVADYFGRIHWTEDVRGLIFDAVQKDGTVLIHSYVRPIGSETVEGIVESVAGLAGVNCRQCGFQGIVETDGEQVGMTEIPCPQCGAPAPALGKQVPGFQTEEGEVTVFDIKQEIVPLFNFVVDRYGARLSGLKGAKWLQISKLMDRSELEYEWPDKSPGSSGQWTFPTQVAYALATLDWRYLNYIQSQDQSRGLDFQKFETKYIYLHEDAYRGYVAPSDAKILDGKGRPTFVIKRNQTIGEAYEAMYGFNPEGVKFIWLDDQLLGICPPDEDQVNLREVFSDVHWLRDSSSYLSSPYHSIVQVQDDITLLNTMHHNIAARNAVEQVYYDSLVFEKSDFSQEYVGTKNAALLPDHDLSKAIVKLPVPEPTPYLTQQLQFLWQIKDSITQVQPAMRGDAQKGETFSAQRQQLEQSYGLLTSVLKSYAQCLTNSFKQKAKLAAKHWTLEQFQRIGSMWGETWSQEEVDEMAQIDFERDLIVSYKNGSEMPQSNLDREMRFMNGLAQLLQFGPDVLFQMLGPEKINKLLGKIDEFANFDFDLTGLEINELIAQKRIKELDEITLQFGDVPFEAVEQARQTVQAIDEMGQPITALDLLIEQIFANSTIRFSPYENLAQQKEFFAEQYRAEVGKTKPNYLLMEAITVMLGMIEQAEQQMQMEAMLADPQVQMEMAAQEDAAAAEKEQANREDAQRAQDRQAQVEDSERQFQQQMASQAMSAGVDLEKAEMQAKAAEKKAAQSAKK